MAPKRKNSPREHRSSAKTRAQKHTLTEDRQAREEQDANIYAKHYRLINRQAAALLREQADLNRIDLFAAEKALSSESSHGRRK
jgi:hypothetical protein